MGTVEVETGESVNHLEAMAQWAHLGRARAPFHLYVPAGSVDIARRLAAENQVNVAEIWSYHTIGDQTRFTLVHRAPRGQASHDQTAQRSPACCGGIGTRVNQAGCEEACRTCSAAKTASRSASAKAASRKPARAQKRK